MSSFVQTKFTRSALTQSVYSCTLANPTTAGNFLVIFLAWHDSVSFQDALTVTDDAGNVWTKMNATQQGVYRFTAFYVLSSLAGATTFQITFAGNIHTLVMQPAEWVPPASPQIDIFAAAETTGDWSNITPNLPFIPSVSGTQLLIGWSAQVTGGGSVSAPLWTFILPSGQNYADRGSNLQDFDLADILAATTVSGQHNTAELTVGGWPPDTVGEVDLILFSLYSTAVPVTVNAHGVVVNAVPGIAQVTIGPKPPVATSWNLLSFSGARKEDDLFFLPSRAPEAPGAAWELDLQPYRVGRAVSFAGFEERILTQQREEEKLRDFRQMIHNWDEEARVERQMMVRRAITVAGVVYIAWKVLTFL